MYLNPCPYCYCHIKRLSIQKEPETIKASANLLSTTIAASNYYCLMLQLE